MRFTKYLACCFMITALTASGAENEPGAKEEPITAAESPAGLQVVLETSKGTIRLQLYPDKAPVTVASFINLIERGFYDGLSFHRVAPGFVIQGGDPDGTGQGGPGYIIENETHPDLRHDGAGVLAMASRGPNLVGCQFYITLAAAPHLNGGYSVFGKVLDGMDVVSAIRQGDLMKKLTIDGDTKALKEKMKERLAEWNSILDQR